MPRPFRRALLGRWTSSSELARARCAPACSSVFRPALLLRTPLTTGAVCCVRARTDLFCSLECVRADILQASTAHRRQTWCERPQRQRTPRLLRWTCATAAHRALVCLALGMCLRWHPSHSLFACAFGSDDAESDKPHGNGSAGPHARAPRRHLARAPRHARSARGDRVDAQRAGVMHVAGVAIALRRS